MAVTQIRSEWDVRAAMNAGVDGYVLQGCPLEELIHGVRMLAQGSRYLCPAVVHLIADSLTREALTSRETDVLGLLAQGASNKLIAHQLGIAVGTVKAHMRSIMDKLDATTRAHVVTVACRRGLVSSTHAPKGAEPEAFRLDQRPQRRAILDERLV